MHIGHSTGGGEATHYAARAKSGTISKLVLIGAVPPVMVKKASNPGGLPIDVFDDFRKSLAADRSQSYIDIASGPFYGFNRKGAKISQGLIQNWWRQSMIGSAKAHYDCIQAFSGNRLHRRSEENPGADACHARNGRSGRALCGRGSAFGQASPEGCPQDL